MRSDIREETRLEGRLRERLEPDPATVERVVRRALDQRVRARRPARWLAAGVAAALVVITLLVLPLLRDPEPVAPVGPSGVRLSMVNVGEVIVARDGRGGVYVLRSGGAGGAPDGSRGQIMIGRGERR